MTRMVSRSYARESTISASHSKAILRAEEDYYDCLARFGCKSAEAHASEVIWRKLRSKERLRRSRAS